jgi:esterase/lipase superfamily enzyme
VKLLFISIQLLMVLSCGNSAIRKNASNTDSTQTTLSSMSFPKDTIIKITTVPVWILSPEGDIHGDILVLPGWNFPKEKICNESDFCTKALEQGYRLILPEMMKSTYAAKYYPETRADYRKNLTLTWVTDTLIKTLQTEHGIFKGENNYLHGISTGARGAALVHLNTGTLFTKVVLLSGDYNNDWLCDDNLMKNTMGSYEEFKDRWQQENNPVSQCKQWTADLYIAHGTNDNVVEQRHSKEFATRVGALKVGKVIQHYPDAKHDFAFWGGETEEILKFFGE